MFLTEAEEAMVAVIRHHRLQPLDDCLCPSAVRPSPEAICAARLHIAAWLSRLTDMHGDTQERPEFKRDPIGFFYFDIAGAQTA